MPPEERSARFVSREQRELRRELSIEPLAELGLVAMDGPNDPRPSLVIESDKVVEIDGRREHEWDALDHFEAVADTRGAVSGGPARDHKLLHDVAAFDDLDAIVGLPNDRARVAANEGVTTQMLAAFDRFKKKRFALAANFPIGRQGRFQVGQQTARDRNQVALRREP